MERELIRTLILSLILGSAIIPAFDAKCYFHTKGRCQYSGHRYEMGESWITSNCLLCTCLHPIGVGCCEIAQYPIDFPEWCETRYDLQTCQVYIVQKEDPSLPCLYKRQEATAHI